MICDTSGFPKNREHRHQSGRAGIELRPRRELGGLRQEYGQQMAAEGTFGCAGAEHWGGGVCGGAAAGAAAYWCEKALSKGLRHLTTGQVGHRTTSRLERHNRVLRRREQLGTVWTEHNLLALLQAQGLLNQTT